MPMSRTFRRPSPFALLIALASLAGASLCAESPAGNPFAAFPAPVSGEYVVYRDYTWAKPTWIGFLYYDDSTYGAFAFTPETGSRVSMLFSGEAMDGTFVLTGQNIISKITQDDVTAVNYLMRLLPDMYAWRASSGSAPSATPNPAPVARSALLPSLVRQNRAIASFGGEVTLTYAPEVPVFGLQGMGSADGAPVLSLVRMGRIQSGGDSAFFDFSPPGEAKAGVDLKVPATRKTESVPVDGVTLNLDDQWTMIADNTFLLGDAALIIVDTLDLGPVGISRESLPLGLVRLFALSSATSWSIPEEISVRGDAKRFSIGNLFIDSASGSLSRDIKTCIPSADGKTCLIVSLSVSETAYRANETYFKSLF